MTVLYVVIPIALLMAGGFLAAFIWCARTGQFDDVETPAMRILASSDPTPEPSATPTHALFQHPSPARPDEILSHQWLFERQPDTSIHHSRGARRCTDDVQQHSDAPPH